MIETTWYDIIGGTLLLVLTSLIAIKMWSVMPSDEPKIILDEKQMEKPSEKVVGK